MSHPRFELELHKVSFSYGNKALLGPISFHLAPGARLGIAGPSGSGKTTLLKLISGALLPVKGQILWQGRNLSEQRNERLGSTPGIALVQQHFGLQPALSADENIRRAGRSMSASALRRFLARMHRQLQIASFKDRPLAQLSGGQMQRVALAAALAAQPQLLLLDEPFSQLDFHLKQALLSFLESECEGISVIMVGHEPSDLMRFCPELMVIDRGRVAQQGRAEQVYAAPKSLRVGQLSGPLNVLSPEEAQSLGLARTFFRPGQVLLQPEGPLRLQRVFPAAYSLLAELLLPSGQKLYAAVAGDWSAAPGSRWSAQLIGLE